MTNIVGAVIALAATIALLVWVIVRSPFGDVNTFAIIICVVLVIGAVLRIVSAVTGRRLPIKIGPYGGSVGPTPNPYDDGGMFTGDSSGGPSDTGGGDAGGGDAGAAL